MSKEIWLPNAETHVTIRDGVVTVADVMTMYTQPLAKPATPGFGKRDEEDE